jgi:hypothetical protein
MKWFSSRRRPASCNTTGTPGHATPQQRLQVLLLLLLLLPPTLFQRSSTPGVPFLFTEEEQRQRAHVEARRARCAWRASPSLAAAAAAAASAAAAAASAAASAAATAAASAAATAAAAAAAEYVC